jgi:hypothetical protein
MVDSDHEYTGGASLASVDPIARLALSVVLCAAKDVHERRRIQRTITGLIFLLGPAHEWLDACGVNVDPDAWQEWVRRGCPGLRLSRIDQECHE